MKVYNDTILEPEHRGGVVIIGNFDGVHRGHQSLFEAARKYASDHQCPLGVMTFTPHPTQFFQRQADSPFLLTPEPLRSELLHNFGADFIVIQNFDKDFAAIRAHHLIERILVKNMGVRAIIAGNDFGFGQNREGNVDTLKAAKDFETIVVNLSAEQENHTAYSSSLIRAKLVEGDIELANQIMGHAFTVVGSVFRNQQLGHTLGFPTANIWPMASQIVPRHGVYAARVATTDGRILDAVVNVGVRPTTEQHLLMYEAHLFDFDEAIYGQTLRIALLHFLRDEQQFPDLNDLRNQIDQDRQTAFNLLANTPKDDPVHTPIQQRVTQGQQLSARQHRTIQTGVFRRLVQHLRNHPEAQNIDMMIVAAFCRNCLANWYADEAVKLGVTLERDEAREIIYGMPYEQWKEQHQIEQKPEKLALLKELEQKRTRDNH